MILIDALALTNGHSSRGIGHYVRRLIGSVSMASAPANTLALHALVTDPAVQCDIPSVQNLATTTAAQPAPWAIHGVLSPLDFYRAGSVALYHATDPTGLSRPRSVPMLATAYDLIPLKFPVAYLDKFSLDERVGYRQMLKRYRLADHIVAISESTRSDFIQMLDIPRDRVSVVYPGIETMEIDADTTPSRSLALDAPFFLYVGALDERKNLHAVLDAFASVCNDLPEDFVIAGRSSSVEAAQLHLHIRKLGIDKRVRILDYVPDNILTQLYRKATALVFMSRYEGFGLPVLEAMSKGCAVICSDAGALFEVAREAAAIVPLDDREALSASLADLSSNPARRIELEEKGFRRAAEFDNRLMGHRMMALYGSILGLDTPAPHTGSERG